MNGHDGRGDDVVAAERVTVATALMSERHAADIAAMLPADSYFANPVYQAVYGAVRYLTDTGQLDGQDGEGRAAMVLNRLMTAERGMWKTSQAAVIVAELSGAWSTVWRPHAQKVALEAVRRRGLEATARAGQVLTGGGFDPDDARDLIIKEFTDAFAAGPGNGLVTAGDLFADTIDAIAAGPPDDTPVLPWRDLRDLIPRLYPGMLVAVCGRPGSGKSTLVQDLARDVALRQRRPVVLFTLEQDRREVMARLLSAEAGVPLLNILGGTLSEDEWARVSATRERFDGAPLYLDDTGGITTGHERSKLASLPTPPALAILDYVQLMTSNEKHESREQEIAAIVRAQKTIGKQLGIPIVMAVQLNRGPENRTDKRPRLSDARGSGAVENDADVGILVYRPEMHEKGTARIGEADLIVEKHRNGPTGQVTLGFQGDFTRFVDLTHGWTKPPALDTPPDEAAPWEQRALPDGAPF